MKIKIKLIRKVEQAAQVVASNDDLLIEILLRLPIKSLIRFKLVSKHWHSLITDPKFCHLRNPKPNPALGLFLLPRLNYYVIPCFEYVPFSVQEPTNPSLLKLKFTKDPHGISIVQSCNGLLLCSSFQAHEPNRRYYVYNPTTKHFTTFPKTDQETGIRKKIRGMYLAFDPAKSPHYKVVCVRHVELDQGEYEYQIEVYSSETGPWIVSSQHFTAEVNFEEGVYWSGSIHWISYEKVESLYFNVDEKRLETTPLPPFLDGWMGRSNYYFGESCDHLNFIQTFGSQCQFNVYEMKRDYSEWFVKYEVDLSPLVTTFSGMISSYLNPMDWYFSRSILCLIRGEKEKDSFLVLQIPGKVIRYNLVCKTFETLHECAEVKDVLSFTYGSQHIDKDVEEVLSFTWTIGFQHIESLCCV
ncbi:F-box protein [Forsythia ovata]|uniref:F-box protein n=1 Tax=Forsythia ovata TaxID=205694 RepID=A0ABD1WK45_9LAMI